jgi:hypothetical protein
MAPFQYLGQLIDRCLICPQKVEIRKDNLKTLNDLQKLQGDNNWLRLSLKLTTDTLSPLFQRLKGNPNPSLLQELMEAAWQALVKVERAITIAQLQRWDP